MRSSRTIGIAVTCVVVVLIAATIAACGGDLKGPQTYTNTKYKFSMVYNADSFKKTTNTTAGGSAGSSSVFDVGFVDPKGTKTGGNYRDGLLVSVYQLTQTVTTDMLPLVKSELEKILPSMSSALGAGSTLNPLKAADVNGVKGFVTDGSFTMDGKPFTTRIYFLINGNLEYQISEQAAQSRWSQLEPKFETMVSSFKTTK